MRGSFLGQMDPPLSAGGHREAKRVLAEVKVQIAYTSPLLRARQTAEYLRCKELVMVPEFREIHYGQWTGKTWQEIENEWGVAAKQKMADWLGVTPPGGEHWSDFLARVDRGWRSIRSGPAPAAIVAHQGVNAALAFVIDGGDPLQFVQGYTEIVQVEYETD
jgi:alpha-ribazole phosphatase